MTKSTLANSKKDGWEDILSEFLIENQKHVYTCRRRKDDGTARKRLPPTHKDINLVSPHQSRVRVRQSRQLLLQKRYSLSVP